MTTMKDIPWYEWLYAINKDGDVWSYPKHTTKEWKWMSKFINHSGYEMCTLWRDNKKKNICTHRLLLSAFILNEHNKREINHINWIKTDNRLENLEWCTSKENRKHAWHNGLARLTPKMLASGRENARKQRKKVMQLTKEWVLCRVYESFMEAHKITWAGASHIWQCCIWKRKTAGWYFWAFPETYNLTF